MTLACPLCGATGVLICHDARCPRTGQREIREIDACEAGSREAYFAHDTQEDQPMTEDQQATSKQPDFPGSDAAVLEKQVAEKDRRIAELEAELCQARGTRDMPIAASKNVWFCKIGYANTDDLPMGSDAPMRDAVERGFRDLLGYGPRFIFSGWGQRLTPAERRVVHGEDTP